MAEKQIIDLKALIPSHWLFPMNKDALDQLLSQNPRTEKNDFNSLYLFAIVKMKESGVTFSSPGASKGRRFLCWFNSHFWNEDVEAPPFEKQDFIFREVYSIFRENLSSIGNDHYNSISAETIVIENSTYLNEEGRSEFLRIHSLKNKEVLFQ